MSVDINYLAVLLAAASSMVVGSIWYARGVFGATWAKLAKVNMDRTPKTGELVWLLGSTFVASLVTAYVLAHVTFLAHDFFDNSFLSDALQTGFWLWLGFTAARIYVHDAFEGRRKKLTLLNFAHELVTIELMALIIGLLKP
jgi:Flp pilus assembly protein protease CpaA